MTEVGALLTGTALFAIIAAVLVGIVALAGCAGLVRKDNFG